jgi:tetratricopeptide (TPR) repeat protein
MMRSAVELAPNWYGLHDQLALVLWSYGLEAEAREAVRRAARSLPLYLRHDFVDGMPDWVLPVFAAEARAALDDVSMLSRTERLISLGKLEIQLGEWERAIETFSEVFDAPADLLDRMETHFNIGVAQLQLGRFALARGHLEQAATHPLMRPAALSQLAAAAEAEGRPDLALQHLRELRQESPRDIEAGLRFARLARQLGDWPAALEALRWARTVHPEDDRPIVSLVEVHLAMGDRAAAAEYLRELRDRPTAEAELARLTLELGSSGRR